MPEAIQNQSWIVSAVPRNDGGLDCFVASAPRNDEGLQLRLAMTPTDEHDRYEKTKNYDK